MAAILRDKFKRDAVRSATTSGLTIGQGPSEQGSGHAVGLAPRRLGRSKRVRCEIQNATIMLVQLIPLNCSANHVRCDIAPISQGSVANSCF
jgi:hypothetical protein